MFPKELMLIKHVHQKRVTFVTSGISYSFKFQPNVCSRCHDLLMLSMNLSDIAVLNIKSSNYRRTISLISKNKTINLMQNADLTELEQNIIKQNIMKHKNLLSYIKMGKEILMFNNIEIEKK